MIIATTGTRQTNDFDTIFTILDLYVTTGVINKITDTIINGDAIGSDAIVKEWCHKNNVNFIPLPPCYKTDAKWYLYRNAELVGWLRGEDKLLVFWDGKSKGTAFTMAYAKSRNIDVNIIELLSMR